ncbi:alpha/beta hydrolase [Priestia endophytica]|nr:alpha/beta hydrolase [Priestia endophytica]RAS80316.1 alpha/beta hydrolase [Priestia endophytica]
MEMNDFKRATIQVPGSSLYYEVNGKGPFLLLIHGGGGDADKFQRISSQLTDHYTVITYDRRGHSRSKLDNRIENYSVETHSDDAHRLLAKLTDKPAYVFGSSSGAVIALDLCIRHPEQVSVLIPHEPVLLPLLDQDEQVQARGFMEALKKNHKSAVENLLSNSEKDISNSKQSMDVKAERLFHNSTYFVEHEIEGILNYSLDISALKSALKDSTMKLLPAGGVDSQSFFAYHCAVALARLLGTEIVEFPGDHGGYNTEYYKEFAEKLHNVLKSI